MRPCNDSISRRSAFSRVLDSEMLRVIPLSRFTSRRGNALGAGIVTNEVLHFQIEPADLHFQ